MIEAELQKILRCPEDHSSLAAADEAVVAQINRGIGAGKVVTVGGQRMKKKIDGGLVREAGDILYPIIDMIPVMLPDEAINLSQASEGW